MGSKGWCQDSVFVDAGLRSLLSEALEQNADVRIAALHVEQAQAQIKAARLNYLPSFALAPSGTSSQVQGASALKTYSLPLTMDWELSLGGRQHGERQMTRAQMHQAKELLRWQQVQLQAEVANTYYTLIMLDRQCLLTQQNIELQTRSLAAIRSLYEVGKMNALAVNQAEATLHDVVASLADLEQQRSQVETAMSLLLGREAGSIERNSWAQTQSLSLDPQAPVELLQLASRPDVLAAQYELQAALGNERVARAAFYPTLRITAEGGWANNLGQAINPAKAMLNLIGSLTQPLFARGTIKAQHKVAQAQRQQAEIRFSHALLTAGGEVKDALTASATAQKKMPVRQRQVEASERSVTNCKEMMQYSQSVNYLDVLTAEVSLLSAQLQQTADWLQEQQALINLYKALCK